MNHDTADSENADRMLRLTRAVEYNEGAYRNSLSSDEFPHWHYCVLTAKTEAQAEGFRRELCEREGRGFFPSDTKLRVYPDPGGERIGTGAATFYALRALASELAEEGRRVTGCRQQWREASDLFADLAILIIHAGGDSRRIPHCSACGKIFAMLPTILHDGSVATLFDILFMGLAGVPTRFDTGVLISSGDVALTFDARGLQLEAPGITGIGMFVEPRQATHHGVYSAGGDTSDVAAYLQKPGLEQMRGSGCIDSRGRAAVDTGLLKISGPAMNAFVELAGIRFGGGDGEPELQLDDAPFGASGPEAVFADLYADIAPALPGATERDDYINDARAYHQPGDAREQIWGAFRERRDVSFRVECAHPALFTHIGNTDQYLQTVTGRSEFGRLYGFSRLLDSHARQRDDSCVLGQAALHETIIQAPATINDGSLVQSCRFQAPARVGRDCVVKGVNTKEESLTVPDETVIYTLPVIADADTPQELTLVYGVHDNPKECVDGGNATLLGKPLLQWLRRRQIAAEAVWPEEGERSLWNARLYPIAEREQSRELTQWMYAPQQPAQPPEEWREGSRLSIAEAVKLADIEAMRERRERYLELVECLRFEDAAARDVDVRVLLGRLQRPCAYSSVANHLVSLAEGADDCLERARLYKVAADVVSGAAELDIDTPVGDAETQESEGDASAADILTDRAFGCVKEAIGSRLSGRVMRPDGSMEIGEWVQARSPVRVDFAGGWSDTPPHSLERPGTVLNVAVQLFGAPPLRTFGRRIGEPVLRLASADCDAHERIETMQQLADYGDSEQPLALHRAAFIVSGVVSESLSGTLRERLKQCGGGFEIVTDSRVPRGSGVGASSILAATVVACVARLQNRDIDNQQIFTDVLYLEQLLGAGGGWQDQVGGVIGGAKFIRSHPEAPLDLQVDKLSLDRAVVDELQQRCLLLYTGKRRIAKNILRKVMGRYISRDSRVTHCIREIQRIAGEVRESLMTGDIGRVGWLLWLHWELQKILDPACTTPWIDNMMTTVEPYVLGGKAVGAGGGGFVLLLAKENSIDLLRQTLKQLTTASEARIYDFEFAEEGLQVARCDQPDIPIL